MGASLSKKKFQSVVTVLCKGFVIFYSVIFQAFDPSGRRSPDAETHYQFLVMVGIVLYEIKRFSP